MRNLKRVFCVLLCISFLITNAITLHRFDVSAFDGSEENNTIEIEESSSAFNIDYDSYLSSGEFYNSGISVLTTSDHPYWCQGEDGIVNGLECDCVDVEFKPGLLAHFYNMLQDKSSDDLNAWDEYDVVNYPSAVQIAPATAKYNCHSYAWHNQLYATNTYWLDDPGVYHFADISLYTEVTTPQVGDIVCYLNAYGDNLHSGIIVSISSGDSNEICGNSDLLIVQSKWGMHGLYEHRGDLCPYTVSAAHYEELSANDKISNIANDVVYYRRVEHTHSFSKVNYSDSYHKYMCTGCGVTIWEEHAVDSYAPDGDYHEQYCVCNAYLGDAAHSHTPVDTGDATRHTMLCDCGDTYYESHSYTIYQSLNLRQHKKLCVCGDYTTEAHTWRSRLNGSGATEYYCTGCGQTSNLLPLNSQTLVILSADEQRALTAAIKGADGDFVLYLDAETGILYLDGELYIFTVPADTVVSSYLEPVAVDEATLSLLPSFFDTETE